MQFLEKVLGVHCRLGEGCAVQVLRVVDWKREGGGDQQGDDMADRITDYVHAHKDATTQTT